MGLVYWSGGRVEGFLFLSFEVEDKDEEDEAEEEEMETVAKENGYKIQQR